MRNGVQPGEGDGIVGVGEHVGTGVAEGVGVGVGVALTFGTVRSAIRMKNKHPKAVTRQRAIFRARSRLGLNGDPVLVG